jgi:multimeric flavodoxin WrbA
MRELNVVAFNGSPRRDGNTAVLLRHVLDELEGEGIATASVQIGGRIVRGCRDCRRCFETQDRRCAFGDDPVNDWIALMTGADGIVLGSPVYFLDVTAEMKALIDRAGLVARANGGLFLRKAGTAVAAVRRSGANHAVDTLHHFLLYSGMVVPGTPVIGMGLEAGDVLEDGEGLARARATGQEMAWLLRRIAASDRTEEHI